MNLCFEDKIIVITREDANLFVHLSECFLLNDETWDKRVVVPYMWPNVGSTNTIYDLLTTTSLDSSTCSLLINVLTYLHPKDISIMSRLLAYIAMSATSDYILSLTIDKIHLINIVSIYLKYREDKYSISIAYDRTNDITIYLRKFGLGTSLETLQFPFLKDKHKNRYTYSDTLVFKFDLVSTLLSKWLPESLNGHTHTISYNYNQSRYSGKITLSIGSYSKEITNINNNYSLHEHITEYIKMILN